jgi:ribosomal protein S18 acetylase RimI-like enzyme
MKVRLATKDDECLIKKIHKESKKEIGGFNLFYSWDNFLKRKTKYLFFVIDGSAFMRYGYSKMLKCYTIKEIGVLNEKKGKGYAKILFSHCKRPLYLTCNTDNETGNKFYEKMGMKLKGQRYTKNKKQKMNVWVI